MAFFSGSPDSFGMVTLHKAATLCRPSMPIAASKGVAVVGGTTATRASFALLAVQAPAALGTSFMRSLNLYKGVVPSLCFILSGASIANHSLSSKMGIQASLTSATGAVLSEDRSWNSSDWSICAWVGITPDPRPRRMPLTQLALSVSSQNFL